MDISHIESLAAQGNELVNKYRVSVFLSPGQLLANTFAISPLQWQSIDYGEKDIDLVPDDKRGIYAFVIQRPHDVFPPHGYIMYIGIAGRKSNRSLRKRYQDYLNPRAIAKRGGITRLIGTWHPVLKFFFAPIDDHVPSADLEELEVQLNNAFMPPFSYGDISATLKSAIKAFA